MDSAESILRWTQSDDLNTTPAQKAQLQKLVTEEKRLQKRLKQIARAADQIGRRLRYNK